MLSASVVEVPQVFRLYIPFKAADLSRGAQECWTGAMRASENSLLPRFWVSEGKNVHRRNLHLHRSR